MNHRNKKRKNQREINLGISISTKLASLCLKIAVPKNLQGTIVIQLILWLIQWLSVYILT